MKVLLFEEESSRSSHFSESTIEDGTKDVEPRNGKGVIIEAVFPCLCESELAELVRTLHVKDFDLIVADGLVRSLVDGRPRTTRDPTLESPTPRLTVRTVPAFQHVPCWNEKLRSERNVNELIQRIF